MSGSALAGRTVALGPAEVPDLLDVAGEAGPVFLREGAGVAGRGVVARIPLAGGLVSAATAFAQLRAFAPACPPEAVVAFAALPFDRHAPGELVVPELTVARRPDGTGWCTALGHAALEVLDAWDAGAGGGAGGGGRRAEALLAPDAAELAKVRSPHDFDLRAVMTHAEWCAMIDAAVHRIRSGELAKVVLARAVDVTANDRIVIRHVLGRLRALYPSCFVGHVDGFVAASPELLVSRAGTALRCLPLAGTVARSGDPDTDARLGAALMDSAKDRWEHQLAVDGLAATLAALCRELHVPPVPSLVPLRNVSHLGTEITGTLAEPAPSALELAAWVHPTPAVGGTPTEVALALVEELEPHGRSRYAGPYGWVDAAGDGAFAVGVRCAEVRGARARLYAGGGIVADSDPEDELAETQLKLQAMLAAIVRP